MTIKLEVGKSYRNRLGEKVTVVQCRSCFDISFLGSDGRWYLKNGRVSGLTTSQNELISEWEEPVKYRAGDLVTIRLTDDTADTFNMGGGSSDWVVKHEPAPEPVSVWVNYYPKSGWFGSACHSLKDALDFAEDGAELITLCMTFNPSTQQATATVVSDE